MKIENLNRQEPFSVPEKYFDNLTDTMNERIKQQRVQPGKWKIITSALQFAAAFILLAGMGYVMALFLQSTPTKNTEIVQLDTTIGEEFDEYILSNFNNHDIIDYLLEEEVSENLLTLY